MVDIYEPTCKGDVPRFVITQDLHTLFSYVYTALDTYLLNQFLILTLLMKIFYMILFT